MKVSNQDKAYWVKEYGVEKEIRFLETLWKHNVDAIINPEKRNDARVHDMKLVQWPGELKSVETPIFKAQVLYDLDPRTLQSLFPACLENRKRLSECTQHPSMSTAKV